MNKIFIITKSFFLVIIFSLLLEFCSETPIETKTKNEPPKINNIIADLDTISPGQQVHITCNVEDPDKDELNYNWSTDVGEIYGSGNSVVWTAPCIKEQIYIYCEVNDGHNGIAKDSISLFIIYDIPAISSSILLVGNCSYPTIQSAINAAMDGDSVIVQPGVYNENIDMKGKDIFLSSLYYLNQDQSYISETIIDGQGKWSVIVINKGETDQCVINGFTIQNGVGVDIGEQKHGSGGGIYCTNSSPILSNLTIARNDALYGAAIYFSQSSSKLMNISAKENYGSYGTSGTIHYSQSLIDLNNVSITGNTGNGIYSTFSRRENIIYRCNISLNTRMGIFVQSSSGLEKITLEETVIANNDGEAIRSSASVDVFHSTISNNLSGIHGTENSVKVSESILWNNSETEVSLSVFMSGSAFASVYYSCVKGGLASIVGPFGSSGPDYDELTNIESDPQFCDPENDNYYLQSSSPCVTAGENGGLVGAFGVGCE